MSAPGVSWWLSGAPEARARLRREIDEADAAICSLLLRRRTLASLANPSGARDAAREAECVARWRDLLGSDAGYDAAALLEPVFAATRGASRP